MNTSKNMLACGMPLLLAVLGMMAGCAGISKGVTEAILESTKRKENSRACFVRGRPIEGITAYREKQGPDTGEGKSARRVLKILMVHGIGSHQPGYSTRMAENLAGALELTRVQEKFKEFRLSFPDFSEKELGVLRISRYLNRDDSQEMIFFELTWDPIVEKEKQSIAFDNSGEYSFRRTAINNTLKAFVNDTIPDVLMFNGSSRKPVQMSVAQSLCWMMTPSWESLPDDRVRFCDSSKPEHRPKFEDEYVFITHSLGSRITVDALQWITEKANEASRDDPALRETMRRMQRKRVTVFMLSNQLPLLQLGQEPPAVRGRIYDICGPGAAKSGERLFGETHLVAFSDPNDLFSYAIPPRFLDEHLDSRLCPTLTNVVLNVAGVGEIFGGKFANPVAAHTEYDNDDRVIGLIIRGIGTGHEDPAVAGSCTWLESVP